MGSLNCCNSPSMMLLRTILNHNIVFHTLLFMSVLEPNPFSVKHTLFLRNMSHFLDFFRFDCTLYTVPKVAQDESHFSCTEYNVRPVSPVSSMLLTSILTKTAIPYL